MAVVSSSPAGTSTSTNADLQITAEQIENVAMTTANVEVVHALPSGTKQYKIRNRDNGLIKLAFSVGTSGTTFFTIYAGETFGSEFIKGSATITLYVQSPTASQTLEVWSGQ